MTNRTGFLAPNSRRGGRLLAALAAAALFATSLVMSSAPEAAADEAETENAAEQPLTVSELEFAEGAAPEGYTSGSEASEADVAREQAEIVESAGSSDADLESVGIARVDLESDNVLVGVTWDAGMTAPASVALRYLQGGTWSEWTELDQAEPQMEVGEASRAGTDPFSLTNTDAVEVVAKDSNGETVSGLDVVVIDAEGRAEVDNALAEDSEAGNSEPLEQVGEASENSSAEQGSEAEGEADAVIGYEDQPLETDNAAVNAAARQQFLFQAVPASLTSSGTVEDTGVLGLKIITRKGWGADESMRSGSVQRITVQGAVVHHFESSNDYTEAQVPGIIRAVYRYHAVTLDWGDIGYNLIVDKFGNVYEGRYGGLYNGVKGAQAYGANSQTFGISMIGSYTNAAPPTVARQAMEKAIAWKLSVHGIESATGTIRVPGYWNLKSGSSATIPVKTVSAHRDIGATDCPGDAFYAQMDLLRSEVNTYLAQIANPYDSVRLSGSDRYATNLAVNQASSVKGKPVFVVTGSDYADALATSPAVASVQGSLFLAPPQGLSAATLAAIKAKAPSAVYIVGGSGAVSEATAAQLKQATGLSPQRVSGSDRYGTAAAVAKTFFGGSNYSTAFVASGAGYADALTAAAAGGTLGGPVLLVDGDSASLPAATRAALAALPRSAKVIAVGGTGVVSGQTLSAVKAATPSKSVERLSGSDRYATNDAVNQYLNTVVSAPTGIWIATGKDFPDALSAASKAGVSGQRLVLSSGSCVLRSAVSSWIAAGTSSVSSVTLVGGPGVLSESLRRAPAC